MTLDHDELEQRVLASEQLLSTLIAILSARDPRLLGELEGIFRTSNFAGDSAGRAAAETWARISAELKATRSLVNDLQP